MSLEVPKNFEELKYSLQNVLPFIATVSLVFFFWYLQNQYFRTYGLNDNRIIFLNLSLLILILFYVFPLKFLFSIILSWITGVNFLREKIADNTIVLSREQFPELIQFFSIGYSLIWLLFYLLYRHAFQQRIQLKLTSYELVLLQADKRDAFVQMGIGTAGFFFALLHLPEWSGFCFLIIPLWLLLNHFLIKRKLHQLGLND
jgi:hypothetical protein